MLYIFTIWFTPTSVLRRELCAARACHASQWRKRSSQECCNHRQATTTTHKSGSAYKMHRHCFMRTIASTVSAFASCVFVATTASAQSSEKTSSASALPPSPILAKSDEASKTQQADTMAREATPEVHHESAVFMPATIRVPPLLRNIAHPWIGWRSLLAFLPSNVLILASACNEVGDARGALLLRSLGMLTPPGATRHTKHPSEKAATSTANVGPRATGVTIGSNAHKEGTKNLYGSVGIMLVHVIDNAAISWKRDPPTTTSPADRFLPSSIVVAPRIDMTTKGFSVTSRF